MSVQEHNKICILEYVYTAQNIYLYLLFRYRIEKYCHLGCPFWRVPCGRLHVSLSLVEQGKFNVSISFSCTVLKVKYYSTSGRTHNLIFSFLIIGCE